MIICNKCGNAIEDTSIRFCTECGADMSMTPNPAVPATIALPPPPMQPTYGLTQTSHPKADPQTALTERRPSPLPWILIPVGFLIVIVVIVFGFKSAGSDNVNSPSGSNTNNSNYRSSSKSNNNIRDPSVAYPNGHWSVCKFTPVNVRSSPNLNAQIITNIVSGDRVWVIGESSNYDTVFINSLKQDVYDNWSEVELENSAVHGWIFSAFIR